MTWERATLGEVCLKVVKRDPVSTGRARVRYIDIGGVDGTLHRLGDVPEIDSVGAPSRCRQIVAAGDTVYSTVRPYLKKIAYVDASLDGEFASTGFSVLRPGPRLEPKFLYYFTISQEMFDQVLPYQKGVSYPAVLDREVRSVSMPVPPLEEQRRIVATLEDHLSHLDAADKYLADGERHIQAWQATVIDEVLWRGNPPMRPIRELLREGMRNGRSDRAVKGQERGTRTLTLTAVTQNSFTDEFTKETVTPPSVADGLWLEPGDIFVQRANTPELVGTSARYEGDRKWAIFPDLLIRLRPDETRIRSEYLVAALRSERTHRQLRAKAKGLAGSMPKIDQRAVAETCVPCPDLGSQIGAVIALNEIADAASALSRDVRAQRRRSAALRRSLLAAAFSGRLTGSSPAMSAVEGRIEA